jgi:hypothetical protein
VSKRNAELNRLIGKEKEEIKKYTGVAANAGKEMYDNENHHDDHKHEGKATHQ